MTDHKVRRLYRRTHDCVAHCTCGDRIVGTDEIDCARQFQVHVMDTYEGTTEESNVQS